MASIDELLAGLSEDSDAEPDNAAIIKQLSKEDTGSLVADIEELVSECLQHGSVNPALVDNLNSKSPVLDGEIDAIADKIRQQYHIRLPELEKIVADPIQYASLVSILGNDPVRIRRDPEIESQVAVIVGKPTSMIIQMSTVDVPGETLLPASVELIDSLCAKVHELAVLKGKIASIAREHLREVAPNVLEIISLDTAVRLFSYLGGLAGMARAPPGNMHAIGGPKKNSLGKSPAQLGSEGILGQDPLLQHMSRQYCRQAIRIIAGKLVLAARVDLARSSRDGSQGAAWREQIETRLSKLGAPPPNSLRKALPVPEDRVGKRRGGKRFRRHKEKYLPTEFQKRNDRVAFGVGDLSQGPKQVTTGALRIQDGADKPRISKSMRARLSAAKEFNRRPVE